MVWMEELLAMHAPAVLAHIRRTAAFDLHETAKILDYTVNMAEGDVLAHLQLCKAFSEHAVMENKIWQE